MNERIRELAEQAKLRPALLLKHWGAIDALTDSEQEELSQLEQFAELIIKECIDICRSEDWEDQQGWGKMYAHKIQKQFGIKP